MPRQRIIKSLAKYILEIYLEGFQGLALTCLRCLKISSKILTAAIYNHTHKCQYPNHKCQPRGVSEGVSAGGHSFLCCLVCVLFQKDKPRILELEGTWKIIFTLLLCFQMKKLGPSLGVFPRSSTTAQAGLKHVTLNPWVSLACCHSAQNGKGRFRGPASNQIMLSLEMNVPSGQWGPQEWQTPPKRRASTHCGEK